MRLGKVRAWHLTDQELDDLVADLEGTEPDHASELRRLKAWRQDYPASPPRDDSGRGYLVVR